MYAWGAYALVQAQGDTWFCSKLKWPFLSLAVRFSRLPELTDDLEPGVHSCLIPGFSGAASPSFWLTSGW